MGGKKAAAFLDSREEPERQRNVGECCRLKKKKASRNIFTSKSLKSVTIILYVKDVVKLGVLKGDAYPRLQEKYPKCHHKCL